MPWRVSTVIAGCLVLADIATLYLMGHPLTCTCGHITLWSGDIGSNENSQQLADPDSFTHFTHGVLLFWALFPFRRVLSLPARFSLALLIEATWEVIENTPMVIDRYRAGTISLGYFGDSALNSSSDILFCVAGFLVATRLPWRWALVAIVGIEAVLAVTIRDGLLLNIVMLLFPIPAIRNWQLGR